MKHHYNKEELIELKRKYDMQVSKEAIEEIKHTIDLDKEIERLHNLLQEIKEYVNVELLSSNADYYRENGGYVSGSDLDVDYIFPILDILDKENK